MRATAITPKSFSNCFDLAVEQSLAASLGDCIRKMMERIRPS